MTGTLDDDRRQPASSGTPAPLVPPLPSTLNTREARRAAAQLSPVKPRAVTGKKAKPSKPSAPPAPAKVSRAEKKTAKAAPGPRGYKRVAASPVPEGREEVSSETVVPVIPALASPDSQGATYAAVPASRAVNAAGIGPTAPAAVTIPLVEAPPAPKSETPPRPKLRPARRSRAPGAFDGNRALTIVVASLAVVSLLVVGVLLFVKNQNPTVEQSMFAAYSSQQQELDGVAAAAASDVRAFTALYEESTELNAAAAAALVAVTGFADEPARVAAENSRLSFESSIAAQVAPQPVQAAAVDDDPLTVNSSVEDLARGINTLNAEAQLLESEAAAAAEALATLTTTRVAFLAALTTFGETIPATATAVIGANSDAAASFRDSVTSAVSALTAALESGDPGVAELQGYATAAAALEAEQARLDAADVVAPAPDTDTDTTPRTTPRTPPRQTPSVPPVSETPAPETPPVESTTPPVDSPVTPPINDAG